MARTAIVNPRRKTKKRRTRKYGRRRNASASGDRSYNPRRRRRAPARRRRNPGSAGSPASSVYSAGGYRRRNPELFDFDNISEKMPAATLGVMAARFAMKMAGPFEPGEKDGAPVPGFKHAIALVLGARFGSQMIGNVLGANKTLFAECGALGFAGDLFTRTRVLNDSSWAKENLYLNGMGDDDAAEYFEEGVSGFEEQSALGAGEYVVGPDGTLYQMSGIAPDPARFPGGVAGFEQQSALGFSAARPSADSGFGYA